MNGLRFRRSVRRVSTRKSLNTRFAIREAGLGEYWKDNEICSCCSAQMESKVLTPSTSA
jgi:hypothetical protein